VPFPIILLCEHNIKCGVTVWLFDAAASLSWSKLNEKSVVVLLIVSGLFS
jgi:hypothetical protein